jgi:anti-sigma28 factor (negative regulator of flagellin synthesis)
MNEIGTIGNSHPALARIAARRAGATQPTQQAAGSAAASDSAQFSPEARLLSTLPNIPDVREDLIAQAKANIEAGVYDSDQVIDATIEKLAEDL